MMMARLIPTLLLKRGLLWASRVPSTLVWYLTSELKLGFEIIFKKFILQAIRLTWGWCSIV